MRKYDRETEIRSGPGVPLFSDSGHIKKAYPGKFEYIEWERDLKKPESLHYMVSTRSNLNVALSAFVQRLMCTGQMDDIIDRSYTTMKSLGLRVQKKASKKRV